MLGTDFPTKKLPPKNGADIFDATQKFLLYNKPDILMGNLEGTLTDVDSGGKVERILKRLNDKNKTLYAFRMPPSYSKLLAKAGFNVLTTSNNHAFDFGLVGFEDTQKNLKKVGIHTAGLAGEVVRLVKKGKRISVIPFSWYEVANNFKREKRATALIRGEAHFSDIVIVSAHGGAEGDKAIHITDDNETAFGEERGNIYRFAHIAIDAGADVVVGHGPHVLRAVKVYKNRIILFSLGNYIAYMMSAEGYKRYSVIVNLIVDEQGAFLRGKMFPLKQNYGNPRHGIPFYDKERKSVEIVQELTKSDINNPNIKIDRFGSLTNTTSNEP